MKSTCLSNTRTTISFLSVNCCCFLLCIFQKIFVLWILLIRKNWIHLKTLHSCQKKNPSFIYKVPCAKYFSLVDHSLNKHTWSLRGISKLTCPNTTPRHPANLLGLCYAMSDKYFSCCLLTLLMISNFCGLRKPSLFQGYKISHLGFGLNLDGWVFHGSIWPFGIHLVWDRWAPAVILTESPPSSQSNLWNHLIPTCWWNVGRGKEKPRRNDSPLGFEPLGE